MIKFKCRVCRKKLKEINDFVLQLLGKGLWNKIKDYYCSDNISSSDKKQNIRNQTLADNFYICLLKTKKYNINTLDKYFLLLISNWGNLK